MTHSVLVVDDEPAIVRAIRPALQSRGYEVRVAGAGEEAIAAIAEDPPDVVILDLGLPEVDGMEVIRRVREWSHVPILVLTARDMQPDKVRALDLGADDYVTKPFAVPELLARVAALLRRSRPTGETTPALRFGDLEVDLARQMIQLRGEMLRLTKTEYRLLEEFVRNPGKLLTQQWLLRHVWGPGYVSETNYLRVYVRQLRIKLGDDATAPRFIQTEPGLGYRWIPEPDAE